MLPSTVCLLYCPIDGREWASYVVTVLQKIDINVVRFEIDERGCISCGGIPLTESAKTNLQRQGQVLIVLSSPDLVQAFMTNPSTQLNQLMCGPNTSAAVDDRIGKGTSDDGSSKASISALMILCATSISDFDGLDSSGRQLSERFPRLDSWTTVGIGREEIERLPGEVQRLVNEANKRRVEETVKRVVHDRQTTNNTTSHTHSKPKVSPLIARQKMEFRMVPTEANCEVQTMIVLSFENPVTDASSEHNMSVEISDDYDETPVKVSTHWLNVHTMYFWAPPHQAGKTKVRVFLKNREIGTRSLDYRLVSPDVTPGIIQVLVHQMSLLCDQLVVKRRVPDLQEVDQMLSGLFQVESPSIVIQAVVYEKFFEMFRFTNSNESSVELPTLIHLAAKYGFRELASQLIDLPDASCAYNVANVDGFLPEHLASTNGHGELAAVLEQFRELETGRNPIDAAEDDDDYVEPDDNDYTSPTENDGFEQIYRTYINSTGEAKRKNTKTLQAPGLYLSMDGSKANKSKDQLDQESEYVDPNSENENEGSDYETVTSPLARFPKPASANDDEDSSLYLDMNKSQTSVAAGLQAAKPSVAPRPRRPPTVAPRRNNTPAQSPTDNSTNQPESDAAAAADITEFKVSSVSQGDGQQELLEILQKVKLKQLTMVEAEGLFHEWKKQNLKGNSSFTQKQAQLPQLRQEVKGVDKSGIGSWMTKLGLSSTLPSRPKDYKKNAKANKDIQECGRHLAVPMTGRTTLPNDRLSTTSSSSRDSTASRASTTSGIDMDFQVPARSNADSGQRNACPPTPPVPARCPVLKLVNAADESVDAAVDQSPDSSIPVYLPLQDIEDSDNADLEDDESYVEVSTKKCSLKSQATMPEMPTMQLLEPTDIQHRKQSLPTSFPPVPPRPSSPFKSHGVYKPPVGLPQTAGRRTPASDPDSQTQDKRWPRKDS